MAGRKTKCTKAMTKEIVGYVELGLRIPSACKLVGINESTYYDWLKRGAAEPRSVFGLFSKEVTKAKAKAELILVGEVRQQKHGASFLLKCVHGYKETQVVEARVEVEMSDEDLEARIAALLAERGDA